MKNYAKRAVFLVIIAFLVIPTMTLAAKAKKTAKKTAAKPAMSTSLAQPVSAPIQGNWYRPIVTTTWQWQLTGNINQSYPVDVYDIDLFDTSPEIISSLKASGKKVLCYFSAGSAEKWRPDYQKFNSNSLGKPLDGWNGEKWLDIRAKNVMDVNISRLDLAVAKGCDGVEPDNVDGYSNKTGFALTKADQLNFNRQISQEAHKRGLTVALKNAVELAGDLVDYFDLTVNEQCHVYHECDQLSVFTKQNKPIFNAEYKNSPKICIESLKLNMRTLILPRNLDDSSRKSCD